MPIRGDPRLFVFLAFIFPYPYFCWPCAGFVYRRCILFNQILKVENSIHKSHVCLNSVIMYIKGGKR